MEQILLYAFAFVFYGLSSWLAFRSLNAVDVLPKRSTQTVTLILALFSHAMLWHEQVFTPEGLRFGFAHVISISCWLVALVTWLESLQNPVVVLEAFFYPVAALAAIMPGWFTGSLMGVYINSVWFKLHLAIAIGAYGLMTIAAAHAVLMSFQEKHLHSPAMRVAGPGSHTDSNAFKHWLDKLPPLLVMERLLFRMVLLGFVFLTLTLISGVAFSEEWFHKAMRFDHKTVFAIISWLIFAALLLGRFVYGWRGKTALRWTMGGFVTLLLAYVGSRFVLEVILKRVV